MGDGVWTLSILNNVCCACFGICLLINRSFPLGWPFLMGRSRPIWNWQDPKTQLGHIWADNILYFFPDSEKSSRWKQERPNNLKKIWHKRQNRNFFRLLVPEILTKMCITCLWLFFDLFVRVMYSNYILKVLIGFFCFSLV